MTVICRHESPHVHSHLCQICCFVTSQCLSLKTLLKVLEMHLRTMCILTLVSVSIQAKVERTLDHII